MTATENVMKLCKQMREQDAPDTQPVLVQLNDLEEIVTKALRFDLVMKQAQMLDEFLKELRNL